MTQKKLNILFFSPDPIYPLIHGNRARMLSLIRALQTLGHRVHVVVLKYKFHWHQPIETMRQFLGTTVDVIPRKILHYPKGCSPFDSWYEEGFGEQTAALCQQYAIDMVICTYVFQSKILEFLPDNILKVIDTHDVMGERSNMLRKNHLPALQFSCSIAEEARYLRRADVVIGITEEETRYFESITGKPIGITITHIEQEKFINRNYHEIKQVGIIASSNLFNLTMVQQFLSQMESAIQAGSLGQITIHLIGNIKNRVKIIKFFMPKMRVFNAPWVKMHGYISDLSTLYAQMDIMISPMMCGTGMNIKTAEAMAYGVPLLTTAHAARGTGSQEPLHQHKDIGELVDSLCSLATAGQELERLADVSKKQFAFLSNHNEQALMKLLTHGKLLE